MDARQMNAETKMYFDQLPKAVQETLMQSGAQFNNVSELAVLAAVYQTENNEKKEK